MFTFSRITTRTTAAAVAAAISIGTAGLVAPAAHAYGTWGAIAVDHDGTWGRTLDYESPAAAREAALAECGFGGCKVLTVFTGCGAVAHSDGMYGGGNGDDLWSAEQDAIDEAGGGYILVWGCN
ncbi:DUF4189 domain-containing protein [Tsukamurella soli]|uniref:DUF4189 domain-containing protein n=1 Tax=Tsukamurella soli TaxID=644556 RepID=A0ABP8JPG3_9ACTN